MSWVTHSITNKGEGGHDVGPGFQWRLPPAAASSLAILEMKLSSAAWPTKALKGVIQAQLLLA